MSEMVNEGLLLEAGLTDDGMSLESETLKEGLVIEARLTDEDM